MLRGTAAGLAGIAIPFIGADPAIASDVFLTTVTDAVDFFALPRFRRVFPAVTAMERMP